MSTPRLPAGSKMHDDLGRPIARWQALVIALGGVDAVTTEIVRVRAAKHHECHT